MNPRAAACKSCAALDRKTLSCRCNGRARSHFTAVEHDGSMPANKEVAPLPGGRSVWASSARPLAAHGGAEADEAQRARYDDGNPARPERHIDAIQGDGPPHHNPDQLQKCDQGKDGGGKRAKSSYGHCPFPTAHEDMLVPGSQNGEAPARRPLPLNRSGFNRATFVSRNRRFATPQVGITSALGTCESSDGDRGVGLSGQTRCDRYTVKTTRVTPSRTSLDGPAARNRS
jgi:hypothetical protein